MSDASFGGAQATTAYLIILVASFLVTWVVTDLLHVPRTPYVAVLTLVSLGLLAGYPRVVRDLVRRSGHV